VTLLSLFVLWACACNKECRLIDWLNMFRLKIKQSIISLTPRGFIERRWSLFPLLSPIHQLLLWYHWYWFSESAAKLLCLSILSSFCWNSLCILHRDDQVELTWMAGYTDRRDSVARRLLLIPVQMDPTYSKYIDENHWVRPSHISCLVINIHMYAHIDKTSRLSVSKRFRL